MSVFEDLVGQRFGRLVVEEQGPGIGPRGRPDGEIRVRWFCRCDCGNRVLVRAGDLKQGGSQSCGCLRAEQQALPVGERGGSQRKDADRQADRMRRIHRAWYRATRLLIKEYPDHYAQLYAAEAELEGVTARIPLSRDEKVAHLEQRLAKLQAQLDKVQR